jgi:deferrochelatase/peroxidase EfeB
MKSAPDTRTGFTRRSALLSATAFGVGVAADRVLGQSSSNDEVPADAEAMQQNAVAFNGPRQAGIATPPPEFMTFAAFDLTSGSIDDLRGLLQEWSVAAAALTKGQPHQVGSDVPGVPGSDPGEADGLGPASLTITVGFGPSLFGVGGPDRFRLRSRRPSAMTQLPVFQGESIDPARSNGDLCVQACADHPQVAFHAIHTLTLIAGGIATLRWSQDGFGRTSSTSRSQATPRNLIGFKDGTNNIRFEDAGAMDDYVWVQPGDGPSWMVGGSYLVARRIKILFDVWDATGLEGQEEIIGRQKQSGAPLGGEKEHDPVDLAALRAGRPIIPPDAHIRLSNPETNGGRRILRRGYSFSEPPEPGSGQIDAGLFFISFQRDPEQFVSIQRGLSESDALNRHTLHTASALFACPPGSKPGGFIGEGLFA